MAAATAKDLPTDRMAAVEDMVVVHRPAQWTEAATREISMDRTDLMVAAREDNLTQVVNIIWDLVATKIAQFSLVTLVLRLINAKLKSYLGPRGSNP